MFLDDAGGPPEPAHLANCALRPDYVHYLIFYTRRHSIGWHVVHTWSPDPVATVREMFLYDFYQLRPTVVDVLAIDGN